MKVKIDKINVHLLGYKLNRIGSGLDHTWGISFSGKVTLLRPNEGLVERDQGRNDINDGWFQCQIPRPYGYSIR